MPENQHTQKLGDILLKGKLINEEQLTIAKREHQITGGKFGSVITNLGYTTEKSIIFFLYRKIFVKKKKRDINFQLEKMLGELLVSYRIISLKDLTNLLAFQQKNNIKLGYALSEINIIDEKSLLDALKHQIFNADESFTGKGGAPEKIEDLTINKKHISIYVPIFLLLFLAIILLPVWYYFTGYDGTAELNDTVAATPKVKVKNKKNTIEEEIIKIENELRFAMSLNKNNKKTSTDDELIDVDSDENTQNKDNINTAEIKQSEAKYIQEDNTDKVFTLKDDESDISFMNQTEAEELTIAEPPKAPITKTVTIKKIRYFSDGKTAKFVFDSKDNLENSFIRSYLSNQNMKFEFNNSTYNAISINNGHNDKLIEGFTIKKVNNASGFVIRYRMKNAGTSLYHVLKPNKQNPLYRLVVVVRPTK